MKRLVIALCVALPIAAGGCATTGYGGGPYGYDGYYDDFYGPVYDGYWGNDGFFYYRGHAEDRRFIRGDAAHFHRDAPGAGNFHHFNGQFTPGRGMHTPHFGGGGHLGGGGHPGGGGHR